MTELPRAGYDFHGVSVGVSSDSPELMGLIGSRLAAFPTKAGEAAEIEFELVHVDARAPHAVEMPRGPGRPVYDPPEGRVTYHDEADQLYVDFADRVRVLADAASSRVIVSIRRADPVDTWLTSHPLFTLPLVEMLKRKGLYSVHSGGVASDGRALLLAGPSGSGKSTLTLALVGAGFQLLGDDMAFLRRGVELEVLAFPDEIDVTEETLELLPPLREQLIAPRTGWPKRQVLARDLRGAGIAWTSRPAIVVLPEVSEEGPSAVPIAREEALLELVPNVLLTSSEPSQRHLDALVALVRDSECFRLKTGPDPGAVPPLLRELLS